MPTDRRQPHERYGVAREDQLHSARTFTAVLLVAALLLLLGGVAHGQYVVAPDGTGDFDDLQTALDQVPTGATVVLAGHVDPPAAIRVQRAVHVRGELPGSADFPNVLVGLVVDAAGADVVLEQLCLGGDYGAAAGDAVEVRGAASLTLRACRLRGGPAGATGIPGAGLRVTGGLRYLHLDACDVGGHATGTNPACHSLSEGGEYAPAPAGGPGLVVPPDLVDLATLDGCLVTGGLGAWVDYACDPDADLPPPGPLVGGDGGPALVGDVDARASAFVGGAPGSVFGDADRDGYLDDRACAGDVPVADGLQGADVVGLVRDRALGATRVAAVLGGTGTATVLGVGAGTLVAWFAAPSLADPWPLRRLDGPLQVLPPWLTATTVADASGIARLQADVPDDPTLAGLPVFVQALAGKALSMAGAALLATE